MGNGKERELVMEPLESEKPGGGRISGQPTIAEDEDKPRNYQEDL